MLKVDRTIFVSCSVQGCWSSLHHPWSDEMPWARSRRVADGPDDLVENDYDPYDECCDRDPTALQSDPVLPDSQPIALGVSIIPSPILNTFYHEHPVQLTLDTGAMSNMVRARESRTFELDALVVRQTRCWCFQLVIPSWSKTTLVFVQPNVKLWLEDPRRFTMALLPDTLLSLLCVVPSPFCYQPTLNSCPAQGVPSAQYTFTHWPRYVFSPWTPTWLPIVHPFKEQGAWPRPQQVLSVDHAVRTTNTTDTPIIVKSGQHLSHVRYGMPVDRDTTSHATASAASVGPTPCKPFSKHVILDHDCLDPAICDKFRALHMQLGRCSQPFHYTMAPVAPLRPLWTLASPPFPPPPPPQRKGRLPQYNRSTLEELQDKFDEPEASGVFAKSEQVNVHVEYLNTSFLVTKPNGASRLVTCFGEVA